jgi:hypothetical protein
MPITIEAYTYNILQSIYYFLNNETYIKSNVTKTLKGHFSDPQLDIVLGFPPALNEIILPTVAIVLQPIDAKEVTAYANQYDSLTYVLNLYGFCGGEQSFEANQKQRDLLCGDIRTLLEETDYIDIYSVSDTPIASDFVTPTSDVLVQNVRSRNLNPTGILIADRYRFLIEFECVYYRSIADENS